MPDGARSWLIHRLGGLTADEARADRRELADMAEQERERAQEARERLRRHRAAIAGNLRSGNPIACPECGSTDLMELMRLPEKVQVRCQDDHRSLWTGEGLPLVPYQEMLARIQREQVEPLRKRLREMREGTD